MPTYVNFSYQYHMSKIYSKMKLTINAIQDTSCCISKCGQFMNIFGLGESQKKQNKTEQNRTEQNRTKQNEMK